MPNHISLSDFVLNRVRCLVSFQIFASRIDFRSVVVHATGFWPAMQPSPAGPDPTQPSPARPSSARAPLAPPGPFLSFDFSRAATSLSPISLSLSRGALGFGDVDRRSWIPEVSSPPFSSLSLPFSPLRARPLQPLRAAPLRPRRAARPALAPPMAAPTPGDVPPRRGPAPCAQSHPSARPRPPARDVLAPGGVAPWPPLARPSRPQCVAPALGNVDPGAVPRASRRGSRGLGVASRPPFTQHVPACAAPRAR
jgi:hypothetical protein